MYVGFCIKKLESVKKSDDCNRFHQTSIEKNQIQLTIPNPANTMMIL
jgi:hypothetical protein